MKLLNPLFFSLLASLVGVAYATENNGPGRMGHGGMMSGPMMIACMLFALLVLVVLVLAIAALIKYLRK